MADGQPTLQMSRLCAVDGLEINEVADGLVVYDPSGEEVHYLNSSAAVIFALCDGTRLPRTIEVQFSAVAGEDGADSSTTMACLLDLVDKGLVR